MGILTDGKFWLLRWPNAGPARTVPPYAFTLEDPDGWITLYEWLRDHALSVEENKQPSRPTVKESFGPGSPTYQRDIATLKALYDEFADFNTIKVKRQLWQNLLTAALGEIAGSSAQMDDLFVRHTYLTAVIGMVVQARFGTDIRHLAEADPGDLLYGRDFRNKTGCRGSWNRTSSPGPRKWAAFPCSRPSPDASQGSTGRRRPTTSPPSCTRR